MNRAHESAVSEKAFEASKAREAKHGERWKSQPANINDVVNRFTPGASGEAMGVKYIFKGDRYTVVADMASGYLRIFDNEMGCYVRLDGSPGSDEDTHFKIKSRGDM